MTPYCDKCNGYDPKKCDVCKAREDNRKKKHIEWEDTQDNRMGYDDYRGRK